MRFTAAALVVPTAALLLATAAPAQTTSPAPSPAPAPGGTIAQQGTPGATQPPLMTAPRPDDKATTDPTASQSGVSGSAPSDEMKRMEAPVGSGSGSTAGSTPGSSPSVAAIPGPIDPEHARALIGQELRSRDGQVAGTIKDFALDDAGDAITRIVLTPDDDVGTPKKLVSVPISMLQMEVPGPAAPGVELSRPPLLNLPAKELANAPEFNYGADVKTVGGKP